MSGRLPWRTGRKVGRTIYDADDELIGVMDTTALAYHVVWGVNTACKSLGISAVAPPSEKGGAASPTSDVGGSEPTSNQTGPSLGGSDA